MRHRLYILHLKLRGFVQRYQLADCLMSGMSPALTCVLMHFQARAFGSGSLVAQQRRIRLVRTYIRYANGSVPGGWRVLLFTSWPTSRCAADVV